MDRFPIGDTDKTQVIFRNALEFIGAVRAGISWERFRTYAVRFSDAFIDLLNSTEEAQNFLSSRGISTDYVQSNIKAIFARLHLNKENDHYLTLALPHTATESQIHKRWKELMRIYHPDRNSDKDAAVCAKWINEAYAILKNPEKKMAYDRKAMKHVEPFSTVQRSTAVHRRKLRIPLFISPEMRRKVPRFILASCAAVSCIALLTIFLINRWEVFTFQASALPEHYRQDSSKEIRKPDNEKRETERVEEGSRTGFQPVGLPRQDAKESIGTVLEKPKKDKDKGAEGANARGYNPPGPRAGSGGVTAQRTPPRSAIQGTFMTDAKSGMMDKIPLEKKESTAFNNIAEIARPEQDIKKDMPTASLQKKPSHEQADVSGGEMTNALPPAPVSKEDYPNLETEVFLFMSQYIAAYEDGDISRFMDLFSKSAVENGRLQYADIMKFYKRNFEGNRYSYTLKNVRLQKGEDWVIVSGLYSIRKMTDDDKGLKKDGMIRWSLAKENGGFKIVRIDYDSK
ncbi:MAG TPA: DnaJ domain-containing protein [Thermodesulfovibrionales bacterium]|nr:DnaJ domain-containing protein [Thermodesulfovibrionales bacterium]